MKLSLHPSAAAAALALPMLTACGESATTAVEAAASLTVEGSAFVLNTGNGRVLRGVELADATVYLALGTDELAPLWLASIVADEEYPDLLRHDFQVPDGQGGWQPACEPDPYGARWGFPVALPPDHPGYENSITLTCASGAVGKCALFGYRPWADGPHGEELLPLHAACVRMARADYCGDGEAHTLDGTAIDIYDVLGIQSRGATDDASFVFEAGWTGAGAVCVDHTRWPDLLSLEQLHAQCPRLAAMPVCDEAVAQSLGAQLFNTSQILPDRPSSVASQLGLQE